MNGNNTQTGFASAPARCATSVSTEMTRSRLAAARGSGEIFQLLAEMNNVAPSLQIVQRPLHLKDHAPTNASIRGA